MKSKKKKKIMDYVKTYDEDILQSYEAGSKGFLLLDLRKMCQLKHLSQFHLEPSPKML